MVAKDCLARQMGSRRSCKLALSIGAEIGDDSSMSETDSHPILATDYLEGADEIAAFLGPQWNMRKVYRARELGALPIRRKQGLGLYAFRSELLAALKAPDTLPNCPQPAVSDDNGLNEPSLATRSRASTSALDGSLEKDSLPCDRSQAVDAVR
jgi:hypothetical protein